MLVFDGQAYAKQIIEQLSLQLKNMVNKPTIAAILFKEDAGSLIYTAKKQEAAVLVGIKYQVYEFSMTDDLEKIKAKIVKLNADKTVTGIIIQKPWRKTYVNVTGEVKRLAYQNWWQSLVEIINPIKDVDGLHPSSLIAIKNGSWQELGKVLPATCQAVWEIMQQIAGFAELNQLDQKDQLNLGQKIQAIPATQIESKKIIIIGRSDLLGQPLFYLLKNKGFNVEMIGQQELRQCLIDGRALKDADLVVSSTGVEGLVKGEMLKSGVALIDVGEPKPDIDWQSVKNKASFITPVPGGVGPVTVACLMKNGVELL